VRSRKKSVQASPLAALTPPTTILYPYSFVGKEKSRERATG